MKKCLAFRSLAVMESLNTLVHRRNSNTVGASMVASRVHHIRL